MDTKKVMILSGGFDPLHSGHIEMFKNAKNQSDFLVVCINSDSWLKNKKGINFLTEDERLSIIKSIKYVDDAFIFEDDEYGSALNGIKRVVSLEENYKIMFREWIYLTYDEPYMEEPLPKIEFIFGNGGDRNPNSTPSLEQKYCEENGISLVWNIGGNKSNSSSWILNRYRDWHFEETERCWGKYKVIYQDSKKKVKVIQVNPKCSLSLQSHEKRSEHWTVVQGTASVYLETEKYKLEKIVDTNESIYVPVGAKHKLINNKDELLEIVEVQIGSYLGEDDIIRYDRE